MSKIADNSCAKILAGTGDFAHLRAPRAISEPI